MKALELWRGLLDGRWSIVDRYEADERHFLVARRNDAHRAKSLALTGRERQVMTCAATGQSNKQIAYELGLSLGTVSSCASTALRKMGLRSRAELVVVAPSSKVAMADAPAIGQGATLTRTSVERSR